MKYRVARGSMYIFLRAVTGGDRQAYRLLENSLMNFHIASCAQLGRRSIKNIHTYGSGFNFYLYKKICPTNYNLLYNRKVTLSYCIKSASHQALHRNFPDENFAREQIYGKLCLLELVINLNYIALK